MPKNNAEEAYKMLERLRMIIENTQFINDIRITISAGVAELKDSDISDDLVRRADEALYKAKIMAEIMYRCCKTQYSIWWFT